jgi:hypothetical protein
MAARDISGSIRNVAINGIAYRVAADCNLTMPLSGYETTTVPSSGSNMFKMVKRSRIVEGLVLLTNQDERAQLQIEAETLSTYTLAVTNAAGDTARATGKINIENHETEENRTTVHLLPEDDWTTSVAEVS